MANSKKRCKHCKQYVLASEGVTPPAGFFCSMSHAVEFASAKSKVASEKRRKKKDKVKLEQIKSLSAVCSEAQSDVNAMIRAVDNYHGHLCIASGSPIEDCGHFYHAGSKYRVSWLRFHHANLHGQGAHSNRYAGGGDALNYLNGMRERYGQNYIDELEDFKRCEDQGLWPKPTKADVRSMASWCRAMTRIYKKLSKIKYL